MARRPPGGARVAWLCPYTLLLWPHELELEPELEPRPTNHETHPGGQRDVASRTYSERRRLADMARAPGWLSWAESVARVRVRVRVRVPWDPRQSHPCVLGLLADVSFRIEEHECVVVAFCVEAMLVDGAVVGGAEGNEVVECGRAAVFPICLVVTEASRCESSSPVCDIFGSGTGCPTSGANHVRAQTRPGADSE